MNVKKFNFVFLENNRRNKVICLILLLIICVFDLYLILDANKVKKKVNEERKWAVTPIQKNTFYGTVLFENGKPAIIKTQLWDRAATYVTIEPPIPNNQYRTYSGIGERNGLFSLYLTDEILEKLKQGECNITINCPCYDDEGGRIYKQAGIFPINLLVNDKSKAVEFRIKQPEDINDCQITYETHWNRIREYQEETLKVHKARYIADAENMAENVEWGQPKNNLRCKLICSEQDIQTGNPLFLMVYLQNVGPNDVKIENNIGTIIDITLNGKTVGKGHEGFTPRTFFYLERRPAYVILKSGEIFKSPLPVVALNYNVPFDDTGMNSLSTSRPGTYNIQAIYPFGNSSRRAENKIISNVLVIRVEPRGKVVYEGQFFMDKSLPVILYHGTENNLYLVQGQNIKFEEINDNITATLKISFETIYDFKWQTELEIFDENGKVLSNNQITDDNKGKAKIIDRNYLFSLGAWSKMTNAKKFRISFIPVKDK
jgi:hypothetical protein